MNFKKAKFIMIILAFIFVFFFSSDFGLIDVEKTSIITAFAIDKDDQGYSVSAQIAVPEATDTNSENQKALLTGKGSTIGSAIKDLGDISGWYPKLSFCNLIIVGKDFESENVIKILDYFAKTLRIQDSALVAFTNEKAEELLKVASPLDNISSFAIQKVLLKASGFDSDIAPVDIKTFCSMHYSRAHSSFMPLIKKIPSDESQQNTNDKAINTSNGGQSNQQGQTKTDGKYLFNAKTTALFKEGVKVGQLDENLTLVFNALTKPIDGTTISVDNVFCENGQTCNYLLQVMSSNPSINLVVDNNGPTLKINLSLYCKINDQNAENSDRSLSENLPLPTPLIEKTESMLKEQIKELVDTSVHTECDFFTLKEKLYRFNHSQYSRFKDNILQKLETQICVKVSGQI